MQRCVKEQKNKARIAFIDKFKTYISPFFCTSPLKYEVAPFKNNLEAKKPIASW